MTGAALADAEKAADTNIPNPTATAIMAFFL